MADHLEPGTVQVPPKYLDALVRAWRTLYTGFILDALVLIGGGIGSLILEKDVTTEAFWITFGILVAKSFMTALGSYLLRLKVTPKNVEPEAPPAVE
jgi:hypothetical protein